MLNKDLKLKLEKLENQLKQLDRVAVAFSGGVDSTFILMLAHKVLGNNVVAFTIDTPYIPRWEIEEATNFTKKIKIDHKVIKIPIIDIVQHNPSDRCYFCKTFIFKNMLNEAKEIGIKYVLDGTNKDDKKDYRPGMKALKELKVISPLAEQNIGKSEIRDLSKELKLHTWDKPAYACLLTRIPYGTIITEKELRRIEEAELYLMSLGFKGVRVRSHDSLARIEVHKDQRKDFFNEEILDKVSLELKKMGYQFVTVDTEGYKMGSLNQLIE